MSEILEIDCGLIERVADRMAEQRLGIPASAPDPDDLLDWGARRFFLVMWRKWE